jgi:plasmid stabilization system protein ParE
MIERVIFSPEADDDIAGSYDWYESQEPGLGEDFFARLRLASEAFSVIPRCIRPPSMSFGGRRFAAFHLRFSTS